jgi:hypothetical protein
MKNSSRSNLDSALACSFQTASQQPKQKKRPSPRITLRLTEEEHAKLTKAAEGVSVSSYIRKKLFGKDVSLRKTRNRVPVRDQQALAQVLGKLGQTRIANNLNQIAYEANCGSLLMDEETEQEIKLACAQIAWIRVKLIEALGIKVKGK